MPTKALAPVKGKKEIAGNGFGPFNALRREMDRLFEDFSRDMWAPLSLGPWPSFGKGAWDGFSPKVDVAESGKAVTVTAELPGMDEKNVSVELSDDHITIKGEKKEESEKKGKDFYRSERSYGSFERTLPLPAAVKANKVEAVFKKGLLTVTLPKEQAAKPLPKKKVAVKKG